MRLGGGGGISMKLGKLVKRTRLGKTFNVIMLRVNVMENVEKPKNPGN